MAIVGIRLTRNVSEWLFLRRSAWAFIRRFAELSLNSTEPSGVSHNLLFACSAPFLRALWLVRATKICSGLGADVVMDHSTHRVNQFKSSVLSRCKSNLVACGGLEWVG